MDTSSHQDRRIRKTSIAANHFVSVLYLISIGYKYNLSIQCNELFWAISTCAVMLSTSRTVSLFDQIFPKWNGLRTSLDLFQRCQEVPWRSLEPGGPRPLLGNTGKHVRLGSLAALCFSRDAYSSLLSCYVFSVPSPPTSYTLPPPIPSLSLLPPSPSPSWLICSWESSIRLDQIVSWDPAW